MEHALDIEVEGEVPWRIVTLQDSPMEHPPVLCERAMYVEWSRVFCVPVHHSPCTVEHNVNVSVLLQDSFYRCLVQHIQHLCCHTCMVHQKWSMNESEITIHIRTHIQNVPRLTFVPQNHRVQSWVSHGNILYTYTTESSQLLNWLVCERIGYSRDRHVWVMTDRHSPHAWRHYAIVNWFYMGNKARYETKIKDI